MVEPGAAPLGVAAAAVLGEGHSSGVLLLPLRGGDGEMRPLLRSAPALPILRSEARWAAGAPAVDASSEAPQSSRQVHKPTCQNTRVQAPANRLEVCKTERTPHNRSPMAAQCLRGRDDVAAAAGSPTFPFFDDGSGCDTILALQRLQSQLARLERERHEAEACSEVLREEIAARELVLARLAAEADAADASDDGTVDDEDDDEAAVVEAAVAAEVELRRAEDRRAAAIDRLAAAAAAARARRPRTNSGARRPRTSPAPRTAAAPARRRSAPRPLVAIDERPPWNSCGRRGISAAEERWTPEPRPPPEPARRFPAPRASSRS